MFRHSKLEKTEEIQITIVNKFLDFLQFCLLFICKVIILVLRNRMHMIIFNDFWWEMLWNNTLGVNFVHKFM